MKTTKEPKTVKCYVCERRIKKEDAISYNNVYLCVDCSEDHREHGGHADGSVKA